MEPVHFDKVNRGVRLLETPKLWEGTIVKGFQRGREIGFKTANLDPSVYKGDTEFLKENHNSVLLGWTMLAGTVYPSVMSLGKNPYFENIETSVEVHLLHEFEEDFYDAIIRVMLVGVFRSMENTHIPSLDALTQLIKADCEFACAYLKENNAQKQHEFFNTSVTDRGCE